MRYYKQLINYYWRRQWWQRWRFFSSFLLASLISFGFILVLFSCSFFFSIFSVLLFLLFNFFIVFISLGCYSLIMIMAIHIRFGWCADDMIDYLCTSVWVCLCVCVMPIVIYMIAYNFIFRRLFHKSSICFYWLSFFSLHVALHSNIHECFRLAANLLAIEWRSSLSHSHSTNAIINMFSFSKHSIKSEWLSFRFWLTSRSPSNSLENFYQMHCGTSCSVVIVVAKLFICLCLFSFFSFVFVGVVVVAVVCFHPFAELT